jgi:hypothetical protein
MVMPFRRGAVFFFAAILTLPIQVARAGSPSSIVSIAPARVSTGRAVNITGTGFDATPANNRVSFTPSSGPASTADASAVATLDAKTGLRRLTVTVPNGLPVGTVRVRVTNRITNEVSDGRSLEIVEHRERP